MVILFTRWLKGENDNVETLHNSVQHFRLECNHNRKKYIMLGKGKPYQKWYGDNFSTTEYGVLADFPFCGSINRTYPIPRKKINQIKNKKIRHGSNCLWICTDSAYKSLLLYAATRLSNQEQYVPYSPTHTFGDGSVGRNSPIDLLSFINSGCSIV
jgi:hypothetical protein